MSIVEFIRARLDEDAAAAAEAIEPQNMHPYGDTRLPAIAPGGVPDGVRGYLGGAWGEHFARHDPVRVLREVGSKRRIVQMYVNALHAKDVGSVSAWNRAQDSAAVEILDAALRELAAPFAGHLDYDEAWRPS
jgi:hypothetical protein